MKALLFSYNNQFFIATYSRYFPNGYPADTEQSPIYNAQQLIYFHADHTCADMVHAQQSKLFFVHLGQYLQLGCPPSAIVMVDAINIMCA